MGCTLLYNLPHTILDIILSDPSISFAVIKIWLTGDKSLQQRLEAGITSVELQTHDPSCGFFFPQVLTRLSSLRHLSVSSNFTLVRH